MITCISVFDPKCENTLNIYRDPETNNVSVDVNGDSMVALSSHDIGSIIEFMARTAEPFAT